MYLLIHFIEPDPPQSRQHIVYYDYLEYQVNGFVGKLTFYNLLMNTLCQINVQGLILGPSEGGLVKLAISFRNLHEYQCTNASGPDLCSNLRCTILGRKILVPGLTLGNVEGAVV